MSIPGVEGVSGRGLMIGEHNLNFAIQHRLVEQGDTRIIDGLAKIVALFDTSGAGRWSALQFLLDRDPNLADTPGRILVDGRVDDVVASARACLEPTRIEARQPFWCGNSV